MNPLEITAWAILAAGALGLAFIAFRQLATFRRDGDIFRGEIALLGEQLASIRATRSLSEKSSAPWNGVRKFQVTRKVPEKGDIYSYYLSPHDGKLPLPSFLPGQFLTFQLQINGKSVTRCYSLSDSPHPDYYRVSIKRCLAPRDQPDLPPGLASSHFHDVIAEGDILDVRAPNGGFSIDPSEGSPIVLSGSGVGLTPVLSMMNALVAAKSRRKTWFFYGVRNGSENMIADTVKQWRELNQPNFHIHICYSNPGPDDILGKDYDHRSRVGVDLFKQLLPSNNYDFYTCGPGPMMQAIRDGLIDWGVPEKHVHDEAFIAVKKSVDVAAASVEFKKSGKLLQVSGTATNLLDLASEEGVDIPSGCCAGSCGTCQIALLSGKVKYDSKPEFAIEAGCCLPCVCLPDGDLVLDA
ncbi:2Fe-2S iron-sulfur cluster-binding protein [Luteolibacter algae]|uniref:2Fe-2S iron-sulfur cluster-binding protein n=1 Tax=Luteolibacter algae TaxID=454151 RepID=A0ABW5D7V7_9BACT